MNPTAAAVKTQRALDDLAGEIREIKDQLTLTLGLVAAIAEHISPAAPATPAPPIVPPKRTARRPS